MFPILQIQTVSIHGRQSPQSPKTSWTSDTTTIRRWERCLFYILNILMCVWSAWSDQKQIYRGFILLNELCCHYELSESDGQKTNNQSKHRSTFPKHSQRSDMADLWDVDVWNVYTPLQWQEVSLCHLTYFVCVFYAFFGSFLTSIS